MSNKVPNSLSFHRSLGTCQKSQYNFLHFIAIGRLVFNQQNQKIMAKNHDIFTNNKFVMHSSQVKDLSEKMHRKPGERNKLRKKKPSGEHALGSNFWSISLVYRSIAFRAKGNINIGSLQSQVWRYQRLD